MPEGKSIYDVAFGAGAETGKYGAELLKTEDIWERMAHRGKVTDWKIEQEATMADVAMDTLGLVSEVYGGYKAGKEFEGALADTSERAAETAYTKGETARSLKDKDKAVKWSDLDPSKQKEWREKFKPEKKQQEWYEVLFGKEAEYKFGESDYFKKSSITASQALSEATSLDDLIGVEDSLTKPTMADDAGLSKKETEKKTEQKTPEKTEEKTKPAEAGVASGEDLLKWGRTFQQWGSEGPRTGGAITPNKAGKMGEFQEFIKSLDIDIGTTGTIESWGPKTQTEYSKLYKQWESFGK